MTLKFQEMKQSRPKAERIAEGTYMGRIVSVVDLGIQPQTDWQTGEATDSKPRVLITWELPTERISVPNEDGEAQDLPRWISKEYTLSNYDQSNLVKLIAGLNPDIASVDELVNAQCMISVGSTSGGNAKVTGVVKPPQGMEVPELESEGSFFDFDSPDQELYEKQVAWVREKIKGAENYSGFADEWE